jgi:hypothetical protein
MADAADRRWPRRTCRIAVALLMVVVAASCNSAISSPAPAPSPVPSLPGTPGHFDDGEMAFDYPADWPVLAAQVPESCGVIYVLVVLGHGSWNSGADQPQSDGSIRCGIDSVTVAPGGAVVRVYWQNGGPAPVCAGYTQANATLGPNAVLKRVDGSVTSWEVRRPGAQFNMDNPVFEVHTSDSSGLAKVEAMVASFRWEANAPGYDGFCSPSPVDTPAS